MSLVKNRAFRVVVASSVLVLAVAWLGILRKTRQVEEALPEPVLAEGAPGLRQSKTLDNLSPQYQQSLWPAGHRDSANTDFVPMKLPWAFEIEQHLLKGQPIFWAPTIGRDGNFYVTTGSPAGLSHLFAISPAGEILWSAKPQEGPQDLDAFAIMNAPTVDLDGDLYLGDRNQLWAFKPDGSVKWVVDLAEHGVDWGFMTLVISRQNYVGGVTTDGKVLFFWAHNGELATPVLELPGGAGPAAKDEPPEGLWQGLMDPEIIPFIFNLIQGWELEVANTPAMHPETGRMYITAAGRDPGHGILYGIDIEDDALKIAFEAPMGGGSGTSPAISQDGRRVYAVDERGRMVAVDADTGRRLWQTEEGAGGSASPSVGADETIYSPFQDHIVAYGPDGRQRWQFSYDALCEEHLRGPSGLWRYVLSEPAAFVDSILTVGLDHGWMNLVCGYQLPKLMSGNRRTRVPIPQKSLFVTFDLEDGSLVGTPVELPETSEGFVSPLPGGKLAVTASGAISSIFYHRLNRFLPEELKLAGPPEPGLLILKPVEGR